MLEKIQNNDFILSYAIPDSGPDNMGMSVDGSIVKMDFVIDDGNQMPWFIIYN